jgi:SHS2 domain-containing protein
MEHTGEVELEIESESERDVFADAFAAVSELLQDSDGDEPGAGEPRVERAISVAAEDRPRLLAAWLGELAFLAETEGLVPEALEDLQVGDRILHATVCGRLADPPHLIKAVTYHRLAFERYGGRWRARAVLDV